MRIFQSSLKNRFAPPGLRQAPSHFSQRPTDLLLVMNPHAGRNAKKNRDREAIAAFARQHGKVVSENGLAAQAQAIGDACREWPEGKPPLVACLGGDGTLRAVINTVIGILGEKALPAFLPLSAGTMNVVWKNLGYHLKLPALLAASHDWLEAGGLRVHEKNLLRVHVNAQGECHFGFIFANGAIYKLIEEFESDANHSRAGFFKILAGLLLRPSYRQKILGKNPIETELPNGEVFAAPMLGALMSTLNQLMFRVQPFNFDLRASDEVGLMVTRYSPGQMFFRWPGVLWRNLRPAFFVEPPQHFSQATLGPVTFRGPGGFSIDGDLYPQTLSQTVRVEPGPLVRFPRI